MKHKIPFLFNLFSSFECFTNVEIEQILSQFEPANYQKGTIILNIGQINDKLIYIQQGILREYSYQDQDQEQEQEQEQDQTITHWLMAENEFQYVADSFLEQVPSTVAIQVVEKAKLWVISKQKLDKLYEEFPQLNFVGRILLEQNIKKYEAFIVALRQKREKRIEWFDKYHKNLTNRVPLKYIATYLNMPPTELSRIRTKIAREERRK
jgi:CRP/FNR family transcriptional regulator, anaerobic regulatory protein